MTFDCILFLSSIPECSPMVRETGVQSQAESYQRPPPKKMVLDAALLNTQHYKVRIKGKVEQSRERSSVLPYTSEPSGHPRLRSPTLLLFKVTLSIFCISFNLIKIIIYSFVEKKSLTALMLYFFSLFIKDAVNSINRCFILYSTRLKFTRHKFKIKSSK